MDDFSLYAEFCRSKPGSISSRKSKPRIISVPASARYGTCAVTYRLFQNPICR